MKERSTFYVLHEFISWMNGQLVRAFYWWPCLSTFSTTEELQTAAIVGKIIFRSTKDSSTSKITFVLVDQPAYSGSAILFKIPKWIEWVILLGSLCRSSRSIYRPTLDRHDPYLLCGFMKLGFIGWKLVTLWRYSWTGKTGFNLELVTRETRRFHGCTFIGRNINGIEFCQSSQGPFLPRANRGHHSDGLLKCIFQRYVHIYPLSWLSSFQDG